MLIQIKLLLLDNILLLFPKNYLKIHELRKGIFYNITQFQLLLETSNNNRLTYNGKFIESFVFFTKRIFLKQAADSP